MAIDYYQAELFELVAGSCGAIIAEILHWNRIARRGRWPKYASSWQYWFITVLVVLAGGVVTAAVSNPNSSVLQLLLLGTAGPQLLYSAAQSYRQKPQNKDVYLGLERSSWQEFLST
jgi:hypothetical protein